MSKNSEVYFTPVKESDSVEAVGLKLSRLIDVSCAFDIFRKSDSVAVKIHFGDEGNLGHVSAAHAAVICRKITDKRCAPFLSDTNTLYRGRRTGSKEHIRLAAEHGFTKEACSAAVIIPDDNVKGSVTDVPIDGKYFKAAKIASVYVKADCIAGVAHFKGHVMTGFGGALKNIGMGCASREGKLAQHSAVAPVVDMDACRGCGACVKSCPTDAITLKNGKAILDQSKCIGCATCIAVCDFHAMEVDWESGGNDIQEKMVEYAWAALKAKKERSVFINFVTRVTKECDCLAKDDPRIAPDVGIFISRDPVAVDKASLDAVIKSAGSDVFKSVHPRRDGMRQLVAACGLGLGQLDYRLVEP